MTSEEGMRQASILLIQTFWGVLGIRWMIQSWRDWKKRRSEKHANALLSEAVYDGWTRWSHFSERGYLFIAYMPSKRTIPPRFMVKVFRNGRQIREFYSSMTYEPVFGPDAGDVAVLERTSAHVLKELS